MRIEQTRHHWQSCKFSFPSPSCFTVEGLALPWVFISRQISSVISTIAYHHAAALGLIGYQRLLANAFTVDLAQKTLTMTCQELDTSRYPSYFPTLCQCLLVISPPEVVEHCQIVLIREWIYSCNSIPLWVIVLSVFGMTVSLFDAYQLRWSIYGTKTYNIVLTAGNFSCATLYSPSPAPGCTVGQVQSDQLKFSH